MRIPERSRPCDVCGKPLLEPGAAHAYHADGCYIEECDCDLWAHPECCPLCNARRRKVNELLGRVLTCVDERSDVQAG